MENVSNDKSYKETEDSLDHTLWDDFSFRYHLVSRNKVRKLAEENKKMEY